MILGRVFGMLPALLVMLVVFYQGQAAKAASFDVLGLYVASSSTGNITLTDSLENRVPGATALFVSDPDNDTFANSLSSGVLYGSITCSDQATCGPLGSYGHFVRRAPTGSTTISAVTFLADADSALAQSFGTQNFLVVIGTPDAYYIGGGAAISANATGTDIAKELDTFFASVESVSDEVGPEGTDLVHTVVLSGTSDGSELLSLLRGNTSTSDADVGTLTFSDGVTFNSGSLQLPAGISSFTITVPTIDDTDVEGDEVYTLSVAGASATGTIQDNDGVATVSGITSATEVEGTDLQHVVTLSSVAGNRLTFPFDLSDVTTTVTDYGAVSFSDGVTLTDGVLSIPDGLTAFSVTVAGADDLFDEADETYTLTIGGVSTTGTITDDDTAAFSGVKTASLTDLDSIAGPSAGDQVTWTITVTNDGTVPLTDISVASDTMTRMDAAPISFSAAAFSPSSVATLAPAASADFTAVYILTQADVDAGGLRNTATVTGTAPGGVTLNDVTDDGDDGDGNSSDDVTEYSFTATPNIALVKNATLNDLGTPGVDASDTISYAYTVVNTGAVTLTGITISDPLVTVSGGPIDLAPGAQDSTSFTATYTITQADIDAGSVSNTATATGDLPGGGTVSDTSGTGPTTDDPTVTPLDATSGIALIKDATLNDLGTPGVDAGDTISYAFTVVNTGGVTLTGITINDPMVAVSGGPIDLAPGAQDSTTFTATYTITEQDVLAGHTTNQATVTGYRGDDPNSDLSGTASDNDTKTVTFLGSIGGTVADTAGPRNGTVVTLYLEGSATPVAVATTSATGVYSFIGLPPGDYCVRFQHASDETVLSSSGSATGAEIDGDQVCGIGIVLGANRAVTGVDALMVDPSGVIYDAVTRAPISEATVTLMYNDTTVVPNDWLAAAGDSNNKVTDATGSYSFLLQSPAPSGTYSLSITASGYTASTLIPAQPGSLTPDTGLGVVEVVPFATAPAAGQDTTHYLYFDMRFPDWTDAESLSKGVVHNHVPMDPVGISTELSLTKVADTRGLSSPARVGDVIRYTITAENSGSLPLTSVSLDDPLTPDETLQAVAGVTDDGVLDPGESWTWTASITLDTNSVNSGSIANLATLSATDAWNARLTLESSPTGNARTGAGNGTPTVVKLDGLLDQIRPELETILEDDLKLVLRRLGNSFSGYSRDAARRLQDGHPDDCYDADSSDGSARLTIKDSAVSADGTYHRETYNCMRREWRIENFEVSYARADDTGTQAMLSFTHRRERLVGEDAIRAFFWGGYGSRSDVDTGTATGRIDGIGLYGGIYGAQRLSGNGIFDYYLAGAVGRHSFTLEFPREITIKANGDYSYKAIFAGASVSREYRLQSGSLTPRFGFDLAYAPGTHVSVTASQGSQTENDFFALDDVGTWNVFLETEYRRPFGTDDPATVATDWMSDFKFRPSLLCEGTFGDRQAECGIGLAMGLTATSRDGDTAWSAEIDGTTTRHGKTASLQLSWERRVDANNGSIRIGGGTDATGAQAVTMELRSDF